MPRVKIDYIVSFSSEDPEHPASNLLNLEVSKKKWLCAKGETTCSVVLQLPRAVKISSLNIGAYHAALVEVLVGRSESTNEQYQWQVLVPSCVFATREESRRGAEVARVRSFSGAQLAPDARAGRWDRLRLVCSQPHDRRQFGLSFVHIDEAESSTPAGVPQRLLALDTFSSDEDDFKPGELFAKHLQKTNAEDITPPSNTGAQIRQATSQALKNISDSSTKLIKNPIVKPSGSCNDNKATASRRPDVQVRQPGPRPDVQVRQPGPRPDVQVRQPGPPRPDEGAPPRQTAQTIAPAETSSSAKRNLDSAKSSTDQNRQLETKKRVRSENRERPSVPTECLLRGATLVL
ncbi:DNA repair protein XRCC1, partial [Spodoptera litura]|uniref:DNA repair protein XRCC1 n=1 Tax=Spodoptera litura TaxID=69820 RepID=A0A9J7EE38_SPOLT